MISNVVDSCPDTGGKIKLVERGSNKSYIPFSSIGGLMPSDNYPETFRRVLVPGGRFVSLEMRSGLHSMAWLWRICGLDEELGKGKPAIVIAMFIIREART